MTNPDSHAHHDNSESCVAPPTVTLHLVVRWLCNVDKQFILFGKRFALQFNIEQLILYVI